MQMSNTEAIARIRDHLERHQKVEPRAVFVNDAMQMAMAALENSNEIPSSFSTFTGKELHVIQEALTFGISSSPDAKIRVELVNEITEELFRRNDEKLTRREEVFKGDTD